MGTPFDGDGWQREESVSKFHSTPVGRKSIDVKRAVAAKIPLARMPKSTESSTVSQ